MIYQRFINPYLIFFDIEGFKEGGRMVGNLEQSESPENSKTDPSLSVKTQDLCFAWRIEW